MNFRKILYKKSNGELIREFKSVLEASKFLNVSKTYISNRCSGKTKQSNGVIFEFKEKNTNKISFFGKKIKKHKGLFSLDSLRNSTNKKIIISRILLKINNIHTVYFIIKKRYSYKKSFEEFKKDDLIQTLKTCGAYIFQGSLRTGIGYIDKYLWLTICLYVATELYKGTKNQVSNKILLNRIEAQFIPTGILIAMENIDKIDFIQLKTALNYILFNSNINVSKYTKSDLNKLKSIEIQILYAINKGYILTFQDLMNELRDMYLSI